MNNKVKKASALLEEYELRLAAEKERNELKAWKEEAMEVMNKLDLQAIGKELQIPLGSEISSQVLPGIKNLKSTLDEAISLLAAKDMLYKAALDEIIKLKTK